MFSLKGTFLKNWTLTYKSTGYQVNFNALGDVADSGILAQSGQFTIVNGGPQASEVVSVVSGTSTVLVSSTSSSETSTGTGISFSFDLD
jgi:hypothetical protein